MTKKKTSNIVPISQALPMKIGKSAERVAKMFDDDSRLLSPKTRSIPTVKHEEMRLGKLLGRGGFNIVREVTLVGREGVYAIKHLKPEILSKPMDFHIGATDLVAEARILNALSHPNVITLHAVPDVPICDSYLNGGHYFLILDRLECTVLDKLEKWGDERSRENLSIHSDAYQMQVEERVQTVALPVARALKYLHSKQVIFRDIKPSNVGFDLKDGTVKLFDFGLAREVPIGRRMTGSTGSQRYMAPEVALSQFYDVKADVFSFGVFLWELTSLGKPFHEIETRAEYINKVAFADHRPETGPQCGSYQTQQLIMNCWKTLAVGRPSMSEVVSELAPSEKLPRPVIKKPLILDPMIKRSSIVLPVTDEKPPSTKPKAQKKAPKFWMRLRPKKWARDEGARAV